jgi:hypothetical protein
VEFACESQGELERRLYLSVEEEDGILDDRIEELFFGHMDQEPDENHVWGHTGLG